MARVVTEKTFITKAEIAAMVKRLGKQITEDYRGKKILLICALKGAFMFMADLVREIDLPLRVDFMAISSYGNGTESSGVVKILKDCDVNITGCHVIIVEDIVDSGLTMKKLMEMLSTRNPASLELCAAFNKPARRKTDVNPKYIGMNVADEFIVGYGLDFEDYYRNIPEVCILQEEEN